MLDRVANLEDLGELAQRAENAARPDGIARAHPHAVFGRDGTIDPAIVGVAFGEAEHDEVRAGQRLAIIGEALHARSRLRRLCHQLGQPHHFAQVPGIGVDQRKRAALQPGQMIGRQMACRPKKRLPAPMMTTLGVLLRISEIYFSRRKIDNRSNVLIVALLLQSQRTLHFRFNKTPPRWLPLTVRSAGHYRFSSSAVMDAPAKKWFCQLFWTVSGSGEFALGKSVYRVRGRRPFPLFAR